MRANARMLLTLDEKSQKRIFEGNALLRRCVRLGLLEEDKRELDYVLAIKVGDIMARRLQTLVFKQNLAKSLHHARVLIRQRHIRVKSQMVNIPSFLVRVEQVSSNRGVSREWVPGMGRGVGCGVCREHEAPAIGEGLARPPRAGCGSRGELVGRGGRALRDSGSVRVRRQFCHVWSQWRH